jgi:hypothetical protein
MNTFLTECNAGLQNAVDFFQVCCVFALELTQRHDIQIHTVNIRNNVTEMKENVRKRHQEVLDVVESLSDATSFESASSVREIRDLWQISIIFLQISRVYSGSHNRYVVPTVWKREMPGM